MYDKEYHRKYYLAHREYILKKCKEKYIETPDVYKNRVSKYQDDNPDKIKETQLKNREKQREKRNNYYKEYYIKKKEQG